MEVLCLTGLAASRVQTQVQMCGCVRLIFVTCLYMNVLYSNRTCAHREHFVVVALKAPQQGPACRHTNNNI